MLVCLKWLIMLVCLKWSIILVWFSWFVTALQDKVGLRLWNTVATELMKRVYSFWPVFIFPFRLCKLTSNMKE